MIRTIEHAFSTPIDDKKLFDVLTTNDKLIITWSSSIDYFQVTNVGGVGKKRVVVLTFDEPQHNAYFVMKEKDWRWNLSTDTVDFSFNYSLGIYAEYSTEAYPSIEFTRSGIKADIKRLTYNSNDMWLPIQAAVLSSGWHARGGMIPKTSVRILFCIPLALLFFGMGMFINALGPLKTATPASPSPQPITASAQPEKSARQERQAPLPSKSDLSAQIAFTSQHITAQNLQLILEGLMKTPSNYINDEIRTTFVDYSNGYLVKEDKREDFVAKLRGFARANKIAGLKQ